jgi:molybdate transport system substrate-binding protein
VKKEIVAGILAGIILAVFSRTVSSAEILVSAAASLTDALTEIGSEYQTQARWKVSFNFGSSSTLARQIEEGAPVDIFFSADLETMDGLAKAGRLEPRTRQNLLSNQLVLVVPVDSRLAIESAKDLLKPGVKRIAVAEPASVPAGIYSRKYLEGEGLWQRLKDKVVPVLDVRATLSSVASGNVEAGFVYRTDAAISKKVKIAYAVPIVNAPRIIYPIAILRGSRNKESAGNFMRFVLSPEARKTFKKYGFVVLK